MKFLRVVLFLFLVGCSEPTDVTPIATRTQTVTLGETISTATAYEDPFLEERIEMVENNIEARGITDPEVLEAMRSVPRHKFVLEEFIDLAYSDQALPIGYGQTISQPYIVATMTELLDLSAGDKVLEIGTGSGYQAAILHELGEVKVYSIEIVSELAEMAQKRLADFGFEEVHVMQGDGYFGWPENAPFDAIIVTAAPDHLPQPLVNQLKEDGKIVIPIGPQGGVQTLWVFEKTNGDLTARNMGLVRFVPFTGEGVDSGYPGP